jgi:hypothetical protein
MSLFIEQVVIPACPLGSFAGRRKERPLLVVVGLRGEGEQKDLLQKSCFLTSQFPPAALSPMGICAKEWEVGEVKKSQAS